jgi:hypothetical protein
MRTSRLSEGFSPSRRVQDIELAEEGEVLARSYELGDNEVLDDEQGKENGDAIAQPRANEPSSGLRMVARFHPPMLSCGAL